MDTYVSRKISFFSFWLIIGVVFVHATLLAKEHPVSAILQFFVFYIFQFGIPLFFMISGYLFFINLRDGSPNTFIIKLKKRVKTLVVPYFVWSLGVFGLIFLLQLLPGVGSLFPKRFIDMDAREIFLNALVYPYNYPLWFLRELIIYSFLTPFIYFFLKKMGIFFLVLLFILSFFVESIFYASASKILLTAHLFNFSIGAWFGIRKNDLRFSTKPFFWVGGLFLGMCLFCSLYNAHVIQLPTVFWEKVTFLISRIKDLFGCWFAWILYDKVKGEKSQLLTQYYDSRFLIYVAHGIPIVVLVKIFERFIFTGPFSPLSSIIASVLVIYLCIVINQTLKKYHPHLFGLSTGSR